MPVATQVIVLTSIGRGAVASVAVVGPRAVAIVDDHFRPASGRTLHAASPRSILYGRWQSDRGEDVIVVRRDECRVEVHCHGGAAAVARIRDSLIDSGCQLITWEQWVSSPRSSPYSSLSPTRRAAIVELARVRTQRAAAVLLDQYNGAFDRAVADVIACLDRREVDVAREHLERLLKWAPLGKHLTAPWLVVLAGPPNVGKSSLINALVGFQRAIVDPTPGTTRDVVSTQTALDGWPVELADTAGLRDTTDVLEAAGVEQARRLLGIADCVVGVFDLSVSPSGGAEHDAMFAPFHRFLSVGNKQDLVAGLSGSQHQAEKRELTQNRIEVSAVTGEGLDRLVAEIGHTLAPQAPPPGQAVPFTGWQCAVIKDAAERLGAGDMLAAQGLLNDLLVGSMGHG